MEYTNHEEDTRELYKFQCKEYLFMLTELVSIVINLLRNLNSDCLQR